MIWNPLLEILCHMSDNFISQVGMVRPDLNGLRKSLTACIFQRQINISKCLINLFLDIRRDYGIFRTGIPSTYTLLVCVSTIC